VLSIARRFRLPYLSFVPDAGWSAWQVLVGLVAIAGGLVAMAFAIADHT
jgi:hypothetical protein